ncbi:MAG: sensor histidine kinase, partial [Lachnospiraceae bacterium]|nr:sensor histidine kinase [Lachnospiraceae bacterium]
MNSLKKRLQNLSMYKKFALAILSLGLIPMLVIFPLLIRQAMTGNLQSIRSNYEQATGHISSTTENALSVYDNVSKIMYQYTGSENALNVGQYYVYFDLFRQVLLLPQQERKAEVESFLRSLDQVDAYIYAVHFLTDADAPIGQEDFHYSYRRTYFENLERFQEVMGWESVDRTAKNLMLIGAHETDYYSGTSDQVFTVARNYYDLRGVIGKEQYIGTLYIDIDMTRLRDLLKTMNLGDDADYFLLLEDGTCLYSTLEEAVGENISQIRARYPKQHYELITSAANTYGISCVAEISKEKAYAAVRSMIHLMLMLGAIVIVLLLLGAYLFSKSLTKPIYEMMDQMKRVESGSFDIHLPVKSNDEIGVLSGRFNEMSHELEKYINQSYVAKIRQSEAELTAIKSQIYPHFLYNTLEIIRMTALENDDAQVSRMIDSLSQQIHYLIGTVEDMVPLEKELDIVEKYVYLLNCRIEGKVSLQVAMEKDLHPMIPKLILQPIVENAYVHGIRPRSGSGEIRIDVGKTILTTTDPGEDTHHRAATDPGEDAVQESEVLEITILDNGVGMDAQALQKLHELLQGDAPGVKNEYNWQSIGMKNVQDRLRYLYGEEYGLQIASTEGIGTSVL